MGVKLPDPVTLMIAYVGAGLPDHDVSSRTPDPVPDQFVQVVRTGGVAPNRAIDRAQVTFTVWGNGDSDGPASRAANDVRDMLLEAASAAKVPLVRRVEVLSGPYADDDPRTGRPRFSITAIITVRASRI